jgi:hypothetical protein
LVVVVEVVVVVVVVVVVAANEDAVVVVVSDGLECSFSISPCQLHWRNTIHASIHCERKICTTLVSLTCAGVKARLDATCCCI